MEIQDNSKRKNVMINYGLLLGILSILISVSNFAFGNAYEPHWSVNVISFAIMVAVIVFGIKKYKDFNNGLLSLGNALKTGVGIALLGAVIFLIYFYIFAKFIEPEFVNRTTELNLQKAIESNPNATQEALDMQENMTKKYFFAFTIGFVLIFNLFVGFIVSLISGLIMKKTDEQITSI